MEISQEDIDFLKYVPTTKIVLKYGIWLPTILKIEEGAKFVEIAETY